MDNLDLLHIMILALQWRKQAYYCHFCCSAQILNLQPLTKYLCCNGWRHWPHAPDSWTCQPPAPRGTCYLPLLVQKEGVEEEGLKNDGVDEDHLQAAYVKGEVGVVRESEVYIWFVHDATVLIT